MKKMLVLAAIVCAAMMSQAASFKWTAGNMYGSNGEKWTGLVSLYGYAHGASVDTAVLVDTATANTTGTVSNKTFSWDSAVADSGYDFYFVIEDAGKTFTSATKANIIAQTSATPSIGFGSQATATQDASQWKGGSSDVPEPTSGLLLLVGLAGLALRRKQA